jgi:hypothetical protein
LRIGPGGAAREAVVAVIRQGARAANTGGRAVEPDDGGEVNGRVVQRLAGMGEIDA